MSEYIPPVGTGSKSVSNLNRETSKAESTDKKYKYVPPVGPGSKSLPPSGSWRDHPSTEAMIRDIERSRGPKLETDPEFVNFDSSQEIFPETSPWMDDVDVNFLSED